MATAEVQHPVPTATAHDGACFQEEEKNHEIPLKDDVLPLPATEVEEAPGAAEEAPQVHASDVSEEETKGHQDKEESDTENDPKHDHHDEADEASAAVVTDAGRLVQAVAQEVEAKLEIVVVHSAADDEVKPPPSVEGEAERRREVPRRAAAANKAVVVPVDDDEEDGLLVDGEADAAPAEVVPEAPAEKEEEAADEDLKEKALEE